VAATADLGAPDGAPSGGAGSLKEIIRPPRYGVWMRGEARIVVRLARSHAHGVAAYRIVVSVRPATIAKYSSGELMSVSQPPASLG
jgi:hypothetical protein